MGKIYTYDIGTRLRTTLNVNLAGFDTVKYTIKKPSGTILTVPVTEVESESDGIVYYDTVSEDLDEEGKYYIQTQIVFASGNKNESESKYFMVYDSFE